MTKSRKISEPGQPDYELARALWMFRHGASVEAFNRRTNTWINWDIQDAQAIIRLLEKQGFTVMHESNIEGG